MHCAIKTFWLVLPASLLAGVSACSDSSTPVNSGETSSGAASSTGSTTPGGSSSGASAGSSSGASSGDEADASSGGGSGSTSSGGSGTGSGSASSGSGSGDADGGDADAGEDMDTGAGSGSGGSSGGTTTSDPDAGVFPIPPGLTKIFDGTSLTGWSGNPKEWSVNTADVAIEGKTGGFDLIKTTMDYTDFRLILTERMVLTGPSTNHLGECFWGGAYAPNNYAFNGCIVFIAPHGSLWDYGGKGNVFQGMGAGVKTDWQQIEILAIGSTGQILAAVDGVQTTNYTRPAKGKASPIGLQSHADHKGDTPGMIEYKDIYVEAPPKSMTLLTLKP